LFGDGGVAHNFRPAGLSLALSETAGGGTKGGIYRELKLARIYSTIIEQ